MNIGADDTSAILRASRDQSSSFIWPLRMWLSGTLASAESRRIVISERVISRLKKQLARLLWIDAARQMSRPRVDFPMAGRPATMIIWPACSPLVRSSRSAKPVGTPYNPAVAVADRLDLVEDAVHDVGERGVVLGRALVGDLVDLGLRLVDDVVDLALAGVAELDDLGAGVDEAAQDRLLVDDLGVVGGVGGDRHVGRQGVEVRRPADAQQLATSLELGGDGHRVGRLAPAVEVDDRVVDDLVGRPVEVDARARSRRRRRSRPWTAASRRARSARRRCPAAACGRRDGWAARPAGTPPGHRPSRPAAAPGSRAGRARRCSTQPPRQGDRSRT